MTERTRDKLARELRAVAAIASPDNAAKYEAFAARAETGEFDDYADTYVCPITQLHAELMAAGFVKFAHRVAAGEFDATSGEEMRLVPVEPTEAMYLAAFSSDHWGGVQPIRRVVDEIWSSMLRAALTKGADRHD